MSLKSVAKPEGYELRAARAQKSESARDWLPQDALYEASLRVADGKAHAALIIAWYELSDAGLPVVKYALSQTDHMAGTALLADTLFELQLTARNQ